ncbi:hypothetical protein GCM10016455_05500 [Aliiroseovarius zhejiangensis]|uniref:Phage tail protein I n=1 Tax=Aliiroseovarius zhejiangensis TaxID=1632025 RepID=A0ABQ3IM43_9RHOB|nr:phage tail protein I [Aliiroseovarius zhejiangensis]GHE88265.1 hypothetical protein GCM10016455_05500 [Aliiroseovarius zhejiangensis]
MSDFETLLPPNATPLERAIEEAAALDHRGLVDTVQSIGSTEDCPASALPFHAWAASVEDWNAGWSEDTKRAVVASSIRVHRRKGTLGAVRAAVKAAGYGNAVVVEGVNPAVFDGSISYDGAEPYGGALHWASYRVYMARPITIEQGAELQRILNTVVPARCFLDGIVFEQAANLYNAAIFYDGAFTYGVV